MEFTQACPFHVQESSQATIEKAYGTISEYYLKTNDLIAEAAELNNLETLFDMQKSSYKQLKDCRQELILLKQMWDLVSLIGYQFESWEQTKWEKIDTDLLQQLIREMQQKQCAPTAPQNKDIKSWRCFVALTDRVKNMGVVLPLITQLHSPFMQERH